MNRQHEIIVIGAGQAGLAMGNHLARRGADFVILDASGRVGDAWRNRWDSLRLFTPARYDALPGMPFPAPDDHLPTKDEAADYLESYARHFDLPVRLGVAVRSLRRDGDRFLLETSDGSYTASHVIVATGAFQRPTIPAFASSLDASVHQLHSSAYTRPGDLPDGPVLVVGAANSGLQIATELAAVRPTSISVGGRLPTLAPRALGRSVFWWMSKLGLLDIPITSRMGRAASGRELILGDSPSDIARRHGVRLLGRAVGAAGDRVSFDDGSSQRFASVVWATGFTPDFSWIDAPVFDERGYPLQHRGVTAVPGLMFIGLPWMHTRGSGLLGWVGRDAEHLAAVIASTAGRTRVEAGGDAVLP